MNAILIGTLAGMSNNRIEVFTRKIIFHYPRAPKKIILLSDVLAVELRKGASVYNLTFIHCGELTFESSDDSSASRPSDSSKFKEVFYFENRENNLDIAARIRNYIKTAIPQLTKQEIAAKLEEIRAKETIESNEGQEHLLSSQPDGALLFMDSGQGGTTLSLFQQHILCCYKHGTPQEKSTTVPLANIVSLELQEAKNASGRLTISYNESIELSLSNDFFRAVFTIYFNKDRQSANYARQIANYIQRNSPQCTVKYGQMDEPVQPVILPETKSVNKQQGMVFPEQSVLSPEEPKSAGAGTGVATQKSESCKTTATPSIPPVGTSSSSQSFEDKAWGCICMVIFMALIMGLLWGMHSCVDYLESRKNNVNVRIESDRRLQEAAEINQEMKFLLDELERVRRRGEKPDKVLKKIDALNERMQRLMDRQR